MKILLMSLFFVFAGFSQPTECLDSSNTFLGDSYSDQEFKTINEFTTLVDKTNKWRGAALDFLVEFEENPDKTITSEELTRIHNDGTLAYKELRDQFYQYIEKAKYMTKIKSEDVNFWEDERSGVYKSQNNNWIYESFKDGNFIPRYLISLIINDKSKKLNFDLCNDGGRDLTMDLKLALASAFILYDNYTFVFAKFDKLERKSKLDQIINKDNMKIQNFLNEVEKEYSNLDNYNSMVRAVQTYEMINKKMSNMSIYVSSFEKYVDSTIQSSYLFSKRNEIDIKTVWSVRRKLARKWFETKFKTKTSKVTNELSKAFGNTVGLVATRKGKLVDMKKSKFFALVKNLKSQLKPMDILLEKTPFRLTDKFIPGHWGHVAIWMGSEQELKSLIDKNGNSLWSLLNKEFQNDIKNGKNVFEALRPGVQANSLEHFLNVDDLAIVRPNFLSNSNKQDYVERLKYYVTRANEQYGKEYDFNFDVETDTKIVCSEIAYVIFTDKQLDWPVEKTAGRMTISPDHVAQRATKSAINNSEYSFTPVVLFHNGKEVDSSKVQRVFERLLDGDYDNL